MHTPLAELFKTQAKPVAEFQHLPLERIDPDPDNPRGDDEAEDMHELIASISRHGVLQAILVRPLAGRFRIVAGERRYRASIANGLTTIPANVRELTDAEAEEIQLIENAQRKDPNPLLLAGRLQRLVDRMRDQGEARPTEAAAEKLGKHPTWISNVLYCSRCRPDVQDLIMRGIVRDLKKIRELESLCGNKRSAAIAAAETLGKVTAAVLNPRKPPRDAKPRQAKISADAVESAGTAGTNDMPATAVEKVEDGSADGAMTCRLERSTVLAFIRASGCSERLPSGWHEADNPQLLTHFLAVGQLLVKPAGVTP